MYQNYLINIALCGWLLSFNTVAANPLFTTSNSNSNWSFAGIGTPTQSPNADLLPPDVAYRFSATIAAPDQLRLNWIIAAGTFLYKSRLQLSLENSPNVELAKLTLPIGIVKHNAVLPDGEIGDVEVYHDAIDLIVPLHRRTIAPVRIILVAKYQGCAEIGVCYPPITQKVSLELPAVVADTINTVAAATDTMTDVNTIAEQDRLANTLRKGTFWGIVATFFGLGVLLAFTPCLFPMFPILSGIIVGQQHDLTTRRAFALSLMYVLGMAAAYTVAGILAALFGHNLQAALQNPWILSLFAIFFIALALAMFDVYAIQLPTSLQSKVSILSNRQKSGNLLGAGIMGLLSALIVGPCIAPPLAGALIYIGQTGDVWLGGTALFALSIGMGTPLLIIGTSAGSILPRAGAWMHHIKIIFGILLLGVAIVILERIVPPFVNMLLSGILLIGIAGYMEVLSPKSSIKINNWMRLQHSLGTVALIYGTLILIGAAAGGRNVLQPLRGIFISNAHNSQLELTFQPIKTINELDRALTQASAQNRPVLLDFYADWCISCKELDLYTFTDPQVQRILEKFVLLKVDVTANDAAAQALLQQRFNLPGPPAIVLYNRQAQEISKLRMIGFITADKLLNHLRIAEQQ